MSTNWSIRKAVKALSYMYACMTCLPSKIENKVLLVLFYMLMEVTKCYISSSQSTVVYNYKTFTINNHLKLV